MRRTLWAVLSAATLVVAGCSSSTSGGGTTVTSQPPPTSTTRTTPTVSAAPPSSTTAGGAALTQQQAQDALLSAADLGSAFSQTSSDDSPSPLPCTPNDPPLDTQVPPQVKALTSFSNADGSALLQEEIDGYKDVATTQRALTIGERGLSCKTATIPSGNGTLTVQLTGPADLTDQLSVKVDKVEGWQVASPKVELVLIAAQVGQQIVALTFTAAKGVDTSTLPKTQTLVEKALANVKDAS